GFNTYIMKAASQYLNSQPKDSVDLYLIGNKGIQHYKRRHFSISKTYSNVVEKIDERKVGTILSPLVQDYLNGKYGKIVLFFNEFISALETRQKQHQVLPVELKEWDVSKIQASDYIYESEKSDVLEEFIKKQLSYSVLQALMESHAAEEGARMAAMDSASDNASEVISDLTLAYNRSRQAAITTELTEIVAGAASLN
ncbi:MAG: F0F1 ATP synthase subunit gamma, partial [bacterium]|nr:F0F1 ATP synthase subunit gamma [bacterium]